MAVPTWEDGFERKLRNLKEWTLTWLSCNRDLERLGEVEAGNLEKLRLTVSVAEGVREGGSWVLVEVTGELEVFGVGLEIFEVVAGFGNVLVREGGGG